MPIYEFYCGDCNTLFNFFSPRVDTSTRPDCPRCRRRRLERRPARFATLSRSAAGGSGGESLEGVDETRLGEVLGSMLGDLETLGENDDPRRLARILRRLGDDAGLEPGPRMEDLLTRLEAGEDPDALAHVDDDLGDDASLEELFRLKRQLAARAAARPEVDETLYFL
jgi:putative FmdB family regulatory protein